MFNRITKISVEAGSDGVGTAMAELLSGDVQFVRVVPERCLNGAPV